MINVVIDKNIKRLVQYGIDNNLIPECERIYSTNMLLEVFGKEDFIPSDTWFPRRYRHTPCITIRCRASVRRQCFVQRFS